jgi:hypothetical protein
MVSASWLWSRFIVLEICRRVVPLHFSSDAVAEVLVMQLYSLWRYEQIVETGFQKQKSSPEHDALEPEVGEWSPLCSPMVLNFECLASFRMVIQNFCPPQCIGCFEVVQMMKGFLTDASWAFWLCLFYVHMGGSRQTGTPSDGGYYVVCCCVY